METHGGNESKFSRWVVKTIRAAKGYADTIETTTKAGVPDLHCILGGEAFWIELKVGDPLIRKEQRVWGYNYKKAGGRSFYVVQDQFDSDKIRIYKNPVVQVKAVGRWLRILDNPATVCTKKTLIEELDKLLVFW